MCSGLQLACSVLVTPPVLPTCSFQTKVDTLEKKLRKQKSSSDKAVAEQIALAEQEMEERWKSKSERMVSRAEVVLQSKLEEALEEAQELKGRNAELLEKVSHCGASLGSTFSDCYPLSVQLSSGEGENERKMASLQQQVGLLGGKVSELELLLAAAQQDTANALEGVLAKEKVG